MRPTRNIPPHAYGPPLTTIHPFPNNTRPSTTNIQQPHSNISIPPPHQNTSSSSANQLAISPSPLSSIPSDLQQPPAQIPHTPNTSLHPVTTRSKSGIFKPEKVNLVTKYPLPDSVEPTCVTQALKSPEWQ